MTSGYFRQKRSTKETYAPHILKKNRAGDVTTWKFTTTEFGLPLDASSKFTTGNRVGASGEEAGREMEADDVRRQRINCADKARSCPRSRFSCPPGGEFCPPACVRHECAAAPACPAQWARAGQRAGWRAGWQAGWQAGRRRAQRRAATTAQSSNGSTAQSGRGSGGQSTSESAPGALPRSSRAQQSQRRTAPGPAAELRTRGPGPYSASPLCARA